VLLSAHTVPTLLSFPQVQTLSDKHVKKIDKDLEAKLKEIETSQ
jgi:hypothetical protein